MTISMPDRSAIEQNIKHVPHVGQGVIGTISRSRTRGILVVMAGHPYVLSGCALSVILCYFSLFRLHPAKTTCHTAIHISAYRINSTATAGQTPDDSKTPSGLQANNLDFGLKFDVKFWIGYAQQQATAHGVNISDACHARLGLGFLQKWVGNNNTLCQNEHGTGSKVLCYAYPLSHQGLACVSRNLQLDPTAFMGSGPDAGASAHTAYLPAGAQGSVKLDCTWNSSSTLWQQTKEVEELPWFTTAYQHTTRLEQQCEAGTSIVQQPVLFVSRTDPTNPWHHSQSLVQVFLTLAVLAANQSNSFSNMQVIIADHFAEGPFIEIYRQLSYPHPLLNLKTLASTSNQTLCFKTSVQAHTVPPGPSFLGYEGVGEEHTCPSILLLAVSHWLRYLLLGTIPLPIPRSGLSYNTASAAQRLLQVPTGHQRLKVLFVSRSWFERSMIAGGGLNGWQQQRVIQPAKEAELVEAVQNVVFEWNAAACAPPVFGWWQVPHPVDPQQGCNPSNVSYELQVVDLSLMKFYPDQALALSETAILVAAHGAALANQLLMRPHRGAIVEVWSNQYHYVNMGHMLGHKHFKTGSQPTDLAAAVKEAMDYVATKY